MRCRHCKLAKICRPRGLCWVCYHTPGVRDKFPSGVKFACLGQGVRASSAPLPPAPTRAYPGSAEKLVVFQERLILGVQLWHPEDAALPTCDAPSS